MIRSLHLRVFKLLLLYPALIFSQIPSGILVVRPREINDILNNPGIGFTTFQRFNGDTLTTLNNNLEWTEGHPIVYQQFKGNLINKQYPQTTIAYWRVYWKYLEPERGRYRWDLIDQALATAEERGQTLMLRVASYGSGNNDVPAWYRDMVGKNMNWKYNNPVNKWLVDPEDPRYVEYFGGFIKELGKRYDGHPFWRPLTFLLLEHGERAPAPNCLPKRQGKRWWMRILTISKKLL